MKIVTVVGARPQFIKIAGLSPAFRQHFTEVLIHTGQHYDYEMSEVFFDTLQLPKPDYHLEVGSGHHGAQTALMLGRIEEVLLKEKPDWMVVIGDTNSTLAGALAAAKLNIPVAHIEAGLRSYAAMPEEINRRLTDHLSALLFTPTTRATQTLQGENVLGQIHQVGDILVEIVQRAVASGAGDDILQANSVEPKKYWLATLHRAELTDQPDILRKALQGLARLPQPVLFPMHPRTRSVIERRGLWAEIPEQVRVLPAVDFWRMLALQRHASGIVTDSGGVQREAYLLGTQCFTMRDETEWPETLEGGWNQLIGQDGHRLANALEAGPPKRERAPVFGDGRSGQQIANLLLQGR